MSWYKSGSVTVVQGSALVAGVGTDFLTSVNPGGIFFGPDGATYEVDSIAAAGALSLAKPYAGASAETAAYAIAPTQSYVVELARQAATLLNTFSTFRDAYLAGDLVGAGLELQGVVSSVDELPATPKDGDAYLVGSSIYVWAKSAWRSSSIRGEKGEIGDANPETLAAAASALESQALAGAAAAQAASDAALVDSAASQVQTDAATAAAGALAAQDWATSTEVIAGKGYGAKKYASDAATSAAAAAASAAKASAGQVNADWDATDGLAHILNKPFIPAGKADIGLEYADNTADLDKPVSTATQSALDLKASLSGAAFAGPVSVPNVADGDNSASAANTAYVLAAYNRLRAEILGGAPAALDALNELAAALGNDPNFSGTMAAALGNRLRFDTNTQGLTDAQKVNAATNLGLAAVARSGSKGDIGLDQVENKSAATILAGLTAAQIAAVLAYVPAAAGGANASGTWPISVTGNAAALSTVRTNWKDHTLTSVVGLMGWKNYGNGHVIFDASAGLSPDSTAVSNTNPDTVWNATYATLMGWNGANTYGVRVDTARRAETADTLAAGATVNDMSNNGWYRTNGDSGWYSSTYGGGLFMQDSTYLRVYNNKVFFSSNDVLTGGNVTAYSDERLKKNWRPMGAGFVQALANVKRGIFDRIDRVGVTQVGVGADSLRKVPGLDYTVSADEQGILHVAYANAALVSVIEVAEVVVDQGKDIAMQAVELAATKDLVAELLQQVQLLKAQHGQL